MATKEENKSFGFQAILPILELLVYFSLGIALVSFLSQIQKMEALGMGRIQNESELFLIPFLSLVLGSLMPNFFTNSQKYTIDRYWGIVLIFLIVWGVYRLPRPYHEEMLFHGKELVLVFSTFCFLMGWIFLYAPDLGFGIVLVGILSGFVLNRLVPIQSEYYKELILLASFLGIAKAFFLRHSKNLYQFLPANRIRISFKIYNEFFLSFLIACLVGFFVFFYKGNLYLWTNLPLLVLSYLIGFALSQYLPAQLKSANFSHSLKVGMHALGISFFLFCASFSFPYLELGFVIVCGVALGYYYQANKILIQNKIYAFILVLVSLFVVWGIFQLTKIDRFWIHSLAALGFLFFFIFLRERFLGFLPKFAVVMGYGFIAFFFIKVPSSLTLDKNLKYAVMQSIYAPTLYLYSNLFEESNNTVLLSKKLVTQEDYSDYLPIEDLHPKIPILLNHPSGILNYYLHYLGEKSYPFYLLDPGGEENESFFSKKFLKKEFPGFSVYYSHPESEPDWNSQFSKNWKFHYILSKISMQDSLLDLAYKFSQVEKYGSYEINQELKIFKNLAHQSILNYCNEYFQMELFPEALHCYRLAHEFLPLGKLPSSRAYLSLLKTTPTPELLPFLEDLAKIPEYKNSIFKSIYPVYVAIQNWDAAIRIVENLIQENTTSQMDRENLEIELVRILLDSGKLDKAYTVIQGKLRQSPQSILWVRLLEECTHKMELRRMFWSPQPSVDTSKIE